MSYSNGIFTYDITDLWINNNYAKKDVLLERIRELYRISKEKYGFSLRIILTYEIAKSMQISLSTDDTVYFKIDGLTNGPLNMSINIIDYHSTDPYKYKGKQINKFLICCALYALKEHGYVLYADTYLYIDVDASDYVGNTRISYWTAIGMEINDEYAPDYNGYEKKISVEKLQKYLFRN